MNLRSANPLNSSTFYRSESDGDIKRRVLAKKRGVLHEGRVLLYQEVDPCSSRLDDAVDVDVAVEGL